MSATSLPVAIEPFKWADRAIQVVADVPLAKFSRLTADLASDQGSVRVACRFERDAQGVAVLRGEADTKVMLTCQRCLEPMEQPVHAVIDLALVHDEDEAERLADDADYLVVAEEGASLADMIEDELLLTVPFTPMHDDCEAIAYRQEEAEETAPVKENPFLVLASLKKPPAKQ